MSGTRDLMAALLRPGNTNCAGCGMSLGLRLLEQALGRERVTLCIPACCGIVTAGAYPTTAYGVPVVATTFAAAAAVAAGVRTIQRLNGDRGHTVCWAGDGGTYDIGLATLSGAAERNDDVIYICYDNEIYGNTGGQRSSATPPGAVTATTPYGKRERKKDIMGIVAAHRVPYAATLSLAHPEDLVAKLRRAAPLEGFRFFLLHAPCPTGWKAEPADTVELVRLAVDSGLFPVYEVFGGRRYRINVRPRFISPEEYFRRQGRFQRGDVDLDRVRAWIREEWDYLEHMERLGAGATAGKAAASSGAAVRGEGP